MKQAGAANRFIKFTTKLYMSQLKHGNSFKFSLDKPIII